jgi:RNA polymerase sigma-70 factor, ECF subfamily
MSGLQANRTDAAHREHVQQLFLKHATHCKGFILGMMPNESLADDVFQEVFLVVTRKAETFTLGSNFSAWMRSIARHKVLEACRRQRRNAAYLSDDVLELLADSAPPDELETGERLAQALRSCMEKLSDRARYLIDLRYLQQLSPEHIAQKMTITISSVNVMLSRTRAALRTCTEKWHMREDANG